MAEKRSVTFETIMADLKARRYAPVYYLMGEEPYFIDRITDTISTEVLTEEERDFNYLVFYGADTTAAAVADAARRYPMMAERMVVIVREAQRLSDLTAIERYLEHPQPSTILVLCHKGGTLDRRKSICGAIERVGALFESKRLRERDMFTFLERYLTERGIAIDPKSEQLIIDSIGTDILRLVSELDKVAIAMGESKRITPEVVERHIGISKDFNTFELRAAIVEKDVVKANRIVKYFNDNPKAGSLYATMPLLFSYFQNLLIAYYCPQRNVPEKLAEWLELRNAWAAKDYVTGMHNYTGRRVVDILAKLREVDARSKGIDNPSTPSEELFRELIFFILH